MVEHTVSAHWDWGGKRFGISSDGQPLFNGSPLMMASGGTSLSATTVDATTVRASSFQSVNPAARQDIVYSGASGRANQWLFAHLGLTGTVTPDATFGTIQVAGLRISPDTVNAGGQQLIYLGVRANAGTGRSGPRIGTQGYITVNGLPDAADTYPAATGAQGLVGVAVNQGGTAGSPTTHRGAFFGGNFNVFTTPLTTATFLGTFSGIEANCTLATGNSANTKYGLSIVKGNQDGVRATYTDAAIDINDQDNTTASFVGWQHGLLFGGYGHLWPMASDSTLIGVMNRVAPVPATSPFLYGIDFSAGTITAGGAGVVMPLTTPASAAATGKAGSLVWDADYVYVCTATNTWKRVAVATWP